MKTLIFKKHLIDNEIKFTQFDNVKDYLISLITEDYHTLRFTTIENLGQAIDGIFWEVWNGKKIEKHCNNKVYQIQLWYYE